MSEENTPQSNEDDEQPTAQAEGGEGDGNVGPAEDIENDPAHDPDDPGLKGLKGG